MLDRFLRVPLITRKLVKKAQCRMTRRHLPTATIIAVPGREHLPERCLAQGRVELRTQLREVALAEQHARMFVRLHRGPAGAQRRTLGGLRAYGHALDVDIVVLPFVLPAIFALAVLTITGPFEHQRVFAVSADEIRVPAHCQLQTQFHLLIGNVGPGDLHEPNAVVVVEVVDQRPFPAVGRPDEIDVRSAPAMLARLETANRWLLRSLPWGEREVVLALGVGARRIAAVKRLVHYQAILLKLRRRWPGQFCLLPRLGQLAENHVGIPALHRLLRLLRFGTADLLQRLQPQLRLRRGRQCDPRSYILLQRWHNGLAQAAENLRSCQLHRPTRGRSEHDARERLNRGIAELRQRFDRLIPDLDTVLCSTVAHSKIKQADQRVRGVR